MKETTTLQEAFRLLDLGEVSYDPWGNGQAYLQWLVGLDPDNALHDRLGFWIHIRTCGTLYFAWTYCAMAKDALDFQEMPGKLIWFLMQTMNLIEDHIYTALMSEDERQLYYRLDYTQPLPDGYIGDLWMGARPPLEQLLSDAMHIVLGRLASEEYLTRKRERPEIATLLDYVIASSPWLQQELRNRFPQSSMADGDEAFLDLWEFAKTTMKGKVDVRRIRGAYDDEDVEQERIVSIIEELQKAGGENCDAFLKLTSAVASALDGKLGGYLNVVTRHDVLDRVKPIRRQKKRHKEESDVGEEGSTPYLDSVPASEGDELAGQWDPDLRSLGLDLDRLTAKEYRAIMRYLNAFEEGYCLDSKRGLSMKQALGRDYETVRRQFNRAKARLTGDSS